MIIAITTSLALIVATTLIHFGVLQQTSRLLVRCGPPRPALSLIAVSGAVVAHLIEVGLYAAAYYALTHLVPVGDVQGIRAADAMDFFYYSTVMYTSLGLGDAFPIGHLRFISSIEALNGLLLIGWSTSFTFLAMRSYWPLTHEIARDPLDAAPSSHSESDAPNVQR